MPRSATPSAIKTTWIISPLLTRKAVITPSIGDDNVHHDGSADASERSLLQDNLNTEVVSWDPKVTFPHNTPIELHSCSIRNSTMEAGGFLQPHLPSPPQSSHGSPALRGPILPETRSYPLKRGSGKESAVIDHVDGKLLEISRRYEKRFNSESEHKSASDAKSRGYENFGEAAKDLESITDVVWVTGTRILFETRKDDIC